MMQRIAIIVSFLISVNALAQTKPVDGATVKVGIRAGINSVLPLESVDDATYEPTVLYHGGLVVNFGRGMLTFQPEVNYSQRSISATYRQQGASVTANVVTKRIEVPLLVKAIFGRPESSARFFVSAGPYGSYVLEDKYQATVLSYGELPASVRPLIDAAIRSDLATINNQQPTSEGRFNYGVAASLGLTIKAGPGDFFLEGRGLYRLGNISQPNSPSLVISQSLVDVRDKKYLHLQASIGYLIPIGGR